MTNDTQPKSADMQMPRRRSDLIERELPAELILYDPENDRAFLLNRTSAAIWDLCDGQHSADRIAGQIALHCDVAVKTVLQDVNESIARFIDQALLVKHDHAV